MQKTKAGILGATGVIGQNYMRLLENHPWFEVSYLAASPKSAGKKYAQAVQGRWKMDTPIPPAACDMMVEDANSVESAIDKCDFVFSALEMSKEETAALENRYAQHDIPVVSNSSAHRFTPDVPMLIPEINPEHVGIIATQRKNHGWKRGFVCVKPNCSLQSYILPIHALRNKGFTIDRVILTTLQAISGAGYPGVASMDILDNTIPNIGGEEEKSENEPMKIFGRLKDGAIVNDETMKISAHCNRVPVIDGHSACVSIGFSDKKNIPGAEEVIKIWRSYAGVPQELGLPTAPKPALIYLDEADRPQPRKDRNSGNGMAVSVGRLRKCNVLDYRFAGLSHNTIRGAAGGAILGAELLRSKGYL